MRNTYSFLYLGENGDVACFRDTSDHQKVSAFAEAATLFKWHDEDLQQCTRELNASLDGYRDIRRNEAKTLSFLITPKGFFLVWAIETEITSNEYDGETLVKKLGIKSESSTSESTEYKEEKSSMLPPLAGWDLKKIKWVGGTPECYGKGKACAVAEIVETTRLTRLHDESLQQCTRELNTILRKYSSKSKHPTKKLRILNTLEGPFLAWMGTGMVSPEDNPETILKALGIE